MSTLKPTRGALRLKVGHMFFTLFQVPIEQWLNATTILTPPPPPLQRWGPSIDLPHVCLRTYRSTPAAGTFDHIDSKLKLFAAADICILCSLLSREVSRLTRLREITSFCVASEQ